MQDHNSKTLRDAEKFKQEKTKIVQLEKHLEIQTIEK